MVIRLLFSPPPAGSAAAPALRRRPLRRLLIWLRWLGVRFLALMVGLVMVYALINPPTTWTIVSEAKAPRDWVDLEDIAPVMRRSVVAEEEQPRWE